MSPKKASVSTLDPEIAARLRAQPFTYSPVGATRGRAPAGFHHFNHSRDLAPGTDFDTVSRFILGWGMQLGAGMTVRAPQPILTEGSVVLLGLGPLRIPCRVIYVLNEDDHAGFGYGTLPGHPECGEEAFLVHRTAAGTLRVEITAFSRPGTPLMRIAGPLGRAGQHLMANRYLRAVPSSAGGGR